MTRKDFELIAETVRNGALSEVGRQAMADAFARALAGTNARFDSERFVAACMRPREPQVRSGLSYDMTADTWRQGPQGPQGEIYYRVVRLAFGGIADEAICPTLEAAEIWVYGAAGREGHTLDETYGLRFQGNDRIYDVAETDAGYRIEMRRYD